MRWLIAAGVAAFLAAAVSLVLILVGSPFEQVILVNDGPLTLKVSGCSVDGQKIPPGRYPTPIDVSDKLICPVFQYRDALYLGCLIVRREKQNNRVVAILQSIQPGITLEHCDPG